MPYRSELWKKRYPELYSILDGDIRQPVGNRFDYNNIVGCGAYIAWRDGFDKHLSHKGNSFVEAELIGFTQASLDGVTKPVPLNED